MLVLATIAVAQDCTISESWSDINRGGKYWRIAANMKSDKLWALSRNTKNKKGGYLLFQFDQAGKKWIENRQTPEPPGSYWNVLAVDPQGNPAFISTNDKIFWKKDNKWKQLDGCSTGVAISPDGTLYSRDCNYYINKYVEANDEVYSTWERVGDKKCSRLAIGEDGRLWIRDYAEDQIMVFDKATGGFQPVDPGFKKFALVTGPQNQVLVTNWANDRMYRLVNGQWKLFGDKKAFELAIAQQGRVFIRNANDRIEMQKHKKICSTPQPKMEETEVIVTPDHLTMESNRELELSNKELKRLNADLSKDKVKLQEAKNDLEEQLTKFIELQKSLDKQTLSMSQLSDKNEKLVKESLDVKKLNKQLLSELKQRQQSQSVQRDAENVGVIATSREVLQLSKQLETKIQESDRIAAVRDQCTKQYTKLVLEKGRLHREMKFCRGKVEKQLIDQEELAKMVGSKSSEAVYEFIQRISKELRVCTQSMHKWEPGKIGAPDPPKEVAQFVVKPRDCPATSSSSKQHNVLKKMYAFKRKQLKECKKKEQQPTSCFKLQCQMPLCTDECKIANTCAAL